MGPPGCAAWCRVGRGAGNQGHPPRLLHRRIPEARLFPGHADLYSPAPSAVTLHSHWELCLWLWGMWAGWAELATALCPRDSCHGNGMGAKEGAAVSLGTTCVLLPEPKPCCVWLHVPSLTAIVSLFHGTFWVLG